MTEINKYNNAKIYTIRSPNNQKYYIGSTCMPLYKRFYQHKSYYKLYLNGKSCGLSSLEILKFDGAYIELLEEFKCENKEQLRKREGELIRQYKDFVVNKRIAGRTLKEYYEENEDKLKEIAKENYKVNEDTFRIINKEYYKANADKLRIKRKEYYKENKDIVREQQKQKFKCECGREIQLSEKSRHQKSIIHKKLMNKEDISKEEKLNKPFICECGITVKTKNKTSHFGSQTHSNILKTKNQQLNL
jgi:hypothetical protein